mmetsp:Transcript_88938/g.247076  ORF Transcript_88938/g.247076 Transcript_88938/m.247076 type:complete len:212 (+) Transcript_88938:777-1412(+)
MRLWSAQASTRTTSLTCLSLGTSTRGQRPLKLRARSSCPRSWLRGSARSTSGGPRTRSPRRSSSNGHAGTRATIAFMAGVKQRACTCWTLMAQEQIWCCRLPMRSASPASLSHRRSSCRSTMSGQSSRTISERTASLVRVGDTSGLTICHLCDSRTRTPSFPSLSSSTSSLKGTWEACLAIMVCWGTLRRHIDPVQAQQSSCGSRVASTTL